MQEVSGSIPLTSTTDDTAVRFQSGLQNPGSPSSRGLGHCPFTAATGVRIPLGTPPYSVACAISEALCLSGVAFRPPVSKRVFQNAGCGIPSRGRPDRNGPRVGGSLGVICARRPAPVPCLTAFGGQQPKLFETRCALMTASLSLLADRKTMPADLKAQSARAYIFGIGLTGAPNVISGQHHLQNHSTDFPVFPPHDPADAQFALSQRAFRRLVDLAEETSWKAFDCTAPAMSFGFWRNAKSAVRSASTSSPMR